MTKTEPDAGHGADKPSRPHGNMGFATSEYELFPLIGLREDEIAFLIYPKAADAAADAWIKMVLARIEEGRVAAQEILSSAGTTGRADCGRAAE